MTGGKLEVAIEGIIPEIALAGEQGMRFKDFLRLVQVFCDQSLQQSGAAGQTNGLQHGIGFLEAAPIEDIATARWAWNWVRTHTEVLVHGDRRWNHLEFDHVLSLPDEPEPELGLEQDEEPGKVSEAFRAEKKSGKRSKGSKAKHAPTVRPRIFATEDLIWRTIAHHSVDYKKLPLMEWQCLLGIASVREKGILQADLTRLIGQDKRSLPRRTDHLASKGYIAKRTTMVRRQKTSQLWLVDFAPAMAREDGHVKIDLSEENLRANLDPVAWRGRWTGEHIDMESVIRTFLAIVKAWRVMRYAHAKAKMGIVELRWQMQVLAKLCRKFVDMGILAYTAARLNSSEKFYKDCVKFIREPDPEEWEKILATGKRHSQVAADGKEPKTALNAPDRRRDDGQDGEDDGEDDEDGPQSRLSQAELRWVPEKPIANTVFDVVDAAKSSGLTNPQISAATVGFHFNRYMGNLAVKTAEVEQPPHLRRFQIKHELVRSGKVSGYIFTAIRHRQDQNPGEGQGALADQVPSGPLDNISSAPDATDSYGFSKIYRQAFASIGTPSTGDARLGVISRGFFANRGRKRILNTASTQAAVINKPVEASQNLAEDSMDIEPPEGAPQPTQSGSNEPVPPEPPGKSASQEILPGKPLGAYVVPSETFITKPKKGRPKKSLFIVFKMGQLKDPNFLPAPPAPAEPEGGTPGGDGGPSNPSQVANPALVKGGRGRKKATVGAYKCETCGDTWKNDTGLKYHKTKSQTPCNPDYIPPTFAEVRIKRKKGRVLPGEEGTESEANASSKRGTRNNASAAKRALASVPRVHVRRSMRPIEGPGPQVRGTDCGDYQSAREQLAKELFDDNFRPPVLSLPAPATPKKVARPPSEAERVPTPSGKESTAKHRVTNMPVPRTALSAGKPVARAHSTSAIPNPEPGLLDAPASSQEIGNYGSYDDIPAKPKPDRLPLPPFHPRRDYAAIINPMKRGHAQLSDIVEHVLDHSNGIFPGDKALFFTLVKVFLESFEEEMPVTWGLYQKTLKRMNAEKLIATHVHLIRNQAARMVPYSIVLRYGLDPNSPEVAAMKENIRNAYPQIYVPEPFSFEEEEIAALDALCDNEKSKKGGRAPVNNSHGPSFRSRRAQIQDVEVLEAPYYEQQSELNRLAIEAEMLDGGSRHHKRAVANGLTLPSAKRVKTSDASPLDPSSYQNMPPGPAQQDHLYTYREYTSPSPAAPLAPAPPAAPVAPAPHMEQMSLSALIDPALRSPVLTPTPTPSMSTQDQFLLRNPGQKLSVAEAIKLYGLLPAKSGPKPTDPFRKIASKFRKLPADLGRLRNPGLQSLPGGYLQDKGKSGVGSTVPVGVTFLTPNTRLEEEDEESDQLSEPASSPPPEASSLSAQPADLDGASLHVPSGVGQHVIGNLEMEPIVLGSNADGSYPALTNNYFMQHDASFVLGGALPDPGWFFRQNMPQSLEQIHMSTPGTAGKPQFWADPDYAKFCMSVNRCTRWELATKSEELLLSGHTLAPEHAFINHSISWRELPTEPTKYKWHDDNQFDLETIPYDDLAAFAQDDGIDRPKLKAKPGPKPRETKVKSKKELIRHQKQAPIELPPEKLERYGLEIKFLRKKRPMTAFPASSEDWIRSLEDDRTEEDWKSEHTRLVAFVVIKTLLGGVGSVIDWGLMMRLFPGQSNAQLRRSWTAMKKDRQSTITDLTDKFRKAYIQAYENREVPPLDFDNVLGYDWKAIILWARDLSHTLDSSSQLPATRTSLDAHYTLSEKKVKDREWRERYFVPTRAVHHRFQDVTSEAMSLPAERKTEPRDIDASTMLVAVSWVRAVCVTEEGQYPTEAVGAKLETLCGLDQPRVDALLTEARRQLQRERIVTKAAARFPFQRGGWRLNNRVFAVIDKGARLENLSAAMDYKRALDEAFRTSGKKRVTYMTDDGMILVLLNLQAQGRICVETTGQPQVGMGFEPGNYETRKFDKRYYHFRLDVSPTETYLYEDDEAMVALREAIAGAAIPTEGPGGAIPLWCDIFGEVDPDRWLKCLGIVLFTLASHGAMRARELASHFKAALLTFEVQLVLDWAQALGIVGAPFPGSAPAVREWWWVAIDAQLPPSEDLEDALEDSEGGEFEVGDAEGDEDEDDGGNAEDPGVSGFQGV